MKKIFIPKIRSRHPSHKVLRNKLEGCGVRTIIRLGSKTPTKKVFPRSVELGKRIIEINTVDAIKNSSSKLLMKQKFREAKVSTCEWFTYSGDKIFKNETTLENVNLENLPYPIVAKHHYGSRGTGNYKIDSPEQLIEWLKERNPDNYIFEKYFSGVREYRLHVSKNGCFYTCRKMLKKEVDEKDRWRRHDDNCVWILEENPLFEKPLNWDVIVTDCVKALKSVGLDLGGFDVRVQSHVNKKGEPNKTPEFYLIEVNSACSLGDITEVKYVSELNKLIKDAGNKI